MRCRSAAALALGVAAMLALPACGDEEREGSLTVEGGTGTETTGTETSATGTTPTETSTSPAGPVSQTLKMSEVDFKLKPARYEVDKAGTIEFEVSNDGKTVHALEVEGGGLEVETEEIQPGDSATLKVDVEPGSYKLYCPVGNHEDLGMVGELNVAG
jgi:uncharacterized cupredoxin-like copper-binding protein